MSIFDDLKDKITEASSTTVQKAKDMSEVTRLNRVISESQNQIQYLYGEIGYQIYCAYRENPIPEVAEQFRKMDELYKAITDCEEQIKELNAGNVCPNCGIKIKPGMRFCSNCGYDLTIQQINIPPKEEIKQEVLYCKGCGAVLEPGTAFCVECGKKVE